MVIFSGKTLSHKHTMKEHSGGCGMVIGIVKRAKSYSVGIHLCFSDGNVGNWNSSCFCVY